MEAGGGSVGTRASRPGGSIPPRFLFNLSSLERKDHRSSHKVEKKKAAHFGPYWNEHG